MTEDPNLPDRQQSPSLEIKPGPAMIARIAVVLVCALGIAITTILLVAGVSKGFEFRRAEIYTYLPDATGLSTESEVRLSGLHIGTVSKVSLSGLLDPQRTVRVDMKVGTEYLRLIPTDSITSISSDTLVGPGFVSIAEGKRPVTLRDRGTLVSEPLKQAQDRANQVDALRDRLKEIDAIVVDISSPNTTVGSLIIGDAEYRKVLGEVAGFEKSVRALVSPSNTIGQALFSDKLYNDIRTPVARLDKTLASIQSGEGAAGRLFASDDQYNTALRQIREMRSAMADVAAGRGAAGKLLTSDEQHARILALLRSSNQLLDSLAKGDSQAAQLLRDPRLYEALNGSMRELAVLLKDFRDNPRKYTRVKLF